MTGVNAQQTVARRRKRGEEISKADREDRDASQHEKLIERPRFKEPKWRYRP